MSRNAMNASIEAVNQAEEWKEREKEEIAKFWDEQVERAFPPPTNDRYRIAYMAELRKNAELREALAAVLKAGRGFSGRIILDAQQEQAARNALEAK